MLHIGHRAFVGIGAYASVLLIMNFKFGFWEAAGIATVISALFGLLLGLPTVRFKADFLAIVTLGFSEIIRSVITNWTSLTRGALGIPGIQRPELFGISFDSELRFFFLTLILMLIIQLVIYRIIKSPYGRVLESIREDDAAARAIGKNVNRYRLQVLVIAAAIAGLAGVFEASRIRFIDPGIVSIDLMAFYMMLTFAGGPGNFWGNIVSTIIFYGVFESIRFVPLPDAVLGALRWTIFTGLFIAILMFKPEGIFSKKLFKKRY